MLVAKRSAVDMGKEVTTSSDKEEIEILKFRLNQERAARRAAELIAEEGTHALYERSRHLEILEKITGQANSNEDFASVLISVLQQICLFCGCSVGHVLWPKDGYSDGSDGALVSTGIFYSDDDKKYDSFKMSSFIANFEIHKSDLSQLLLLDTASWISESVSAAGISRNIVAQECGLGFCFRCPVMLAGSVVLVFEFFSRQQLNVDETLSYTLRQVCTQVARTVERDRYQSRIIKLNSELKILVESADRERAAAEAANSSKTLFLANMSHEIRTPLNGVLGMAQAMAADELSTVQRERLGVVTQSGQVLLAILNDILDLTKIEAGKLELEAIEFDIALLICGCKENFKCLAERKGLQINVMVCDDSEGIYLGDPTRLKQICYNLISNAIKFTDVGEVSIFVSRVGNLLTIAVKDTGLGMTTAQMARLFQKFSQADASTTRRFGGTGLGLALVKELAIAMGGDVEVDSRSGEGSTFTVKLELLRVSDSSISHRSENAALDVIDGADAALFEQLRVLVAEDNAVNQLVIRTLLQQVDIYPTIVDNGVRAVEAWAENEWDIILMDVQMPEMDGPTAASVIRQREIQTGRNRTPILALTANAMNHQIAEYIAAGMDGHVAKPIEVMSLYNTLEGILSKQEASSKSPESAVAA